MAIPVETQDALAAKFEDPGRPGHHVDGMSSAAVAAMPDISEADQAQMTARIKASSEVRWQVIQRGFWVNGVADLPEYLAAIAPFRLDGRAENIRCPSWPLPPRKILWPPPPN